MLKLQCLLTSLFSNLKGPISFHNSEDQLLISEIYMFLMIVSIVLVRGGAER